MNSSWIKFVCSLGILAGFQTVSLAENWPAWRGPHGQGVCLETNLPTTWSRTQNVRWSVKLPDRGNSTPVIWGDKVFITQAVEADGRRMVICFNRKNGEKLWEQGVVYSEKEPTHETNPPCSGSPVTDGERVYAFFDSAGLHCYDMDGRKVWSKDLGPLRHVWGGGNSPMLAGDLCLLNFGPGERTFLVAFDKKTGKEVWRHEEAGGKFGDTQKEWLGSWSTPLLVTWNGKKELLMTYPGRLCSFDPATGKENWTSGGLNPLVYTSPLFSDGMAVAMGGFSGSAVAVKMGGQGDVTSSHRVWHHPKTKQRIGSGVIHNKVIYVLNDPGVAESIDLLTGKVLAEVRLTGKGAKNSSWSSMVSAGNLLYVVNHSGDTFVLKAEPSMPVVSVNSLEEGCNASVAPSDGQIFLRTFEALWCIGL